MSTSERRRFNRVDFQTQTTLKQGTQCWTTELIDISLHGALVQLPSGSQPELSSDLQVEIILADDTAIFLEAKPIRLVNGCLALECTSIDIDSISHLRRLIELNTGDPEACERDLAELISIA